MTPWMAVAVSDAPVSLAILRDAAMKGSVLLAVAGVAAVALRRQQAAARHLVWASALIGLLAMPLLSATLPRWRLALPVALPDAPELSALAEVMPPPVEPEEDVPAEGVSRTNRVHTLVAARPGPATARLWLPPAPSANWIVRTWALGVLIALVSPVFGLASLALLGRAARPVTDAAWLALLERVRGELGLQCEVRLVQSARRVVPMTWGLVRPTVLLPEDAGTWSEGARRAVLLHELAHVRRGDCATQLLGRLACALHWFNPLAWFALAQARTEQERACDDCVLNSGSDPADYAEQLLMIASKRRLRHLGASVALAMGASFRIERRLRAILDTQRSRRPLSPARRALATAAALASTLALASFSLRPADAAPPLKPALALQVRAAEDQEPLKDPADVLAAVRTHYIKDTDESVLRNGAIKGLIDALHDPYSQYLDAQEAAGLTRQLQGTLTGIGALLELKDGRPAIRGTLPGSPAFKAGLKPGELIAEVDGKSTQGMDLNSVVRLIVGAAGRPVSLTLESAGGERRKQTITRAEIQVESVRGFTRDEQHRWNFLLDPKQKIGYARVSQFIPTTAKELTTAVDEERLDGLILDLRDCPGGQLDGALACVKLFLAKGKILSIRGRGERQDSYEADGKAPFGDLPLVVLINGRTASAGEVVSAALKDNGRAVLVGTRTFGKGSIQTILPLKNEQGLIKLTTAHYYPPSGRNIDRTAGGDQWGVDPTDGDVVRVDAKQADALRKRVEAREAEARAAKVAADITPERLAAEELDPQLAAAYKAMVAKLRTGTFAKVGEPAAEPVAQDDRLDAIQKRREALLEDLKQVDRELEALKGKPRP